MNGVLSFLTEVSKSQTITTALYLAFITVLSAFFEAYSSRLADTSNFSCKGSAGKYNAVYCLKEYNRGPNGLHKWLYLTSTYIPLSVLIIGMLLMSIKVGRLRRAPRSTGFNCKLHIHAIHFSRLIISFLIHLSLGIILMMYMWIVDDHVLDKDGAYACSIGDSTIQCVDGKAESRSHLNTACSSIHIILTLCIFTELVYYLYKWSRTKGERINFSDPKIKCKDCGYFIKKFNAFSRM